jgi:hypothetical protein
MLHCRYSHSRIHLVDMCQVFHKSYTQWNTLHTQTHTHTHTHKHRYDMSRISQFSILFEYKRQNMYLQLNALTLLKATKDIMLYALTQAVVSSGIEAIVCIATVGHTRVGLGTGIATASTSCTHTHHTQLHSYSTCVVGVTVHSYIKNEEGVQYTCIQLYYTCSRCTVYLYTVILHL